MVPTFKFFDDLVQILDFKKILQKSTSIDKADIFDLYYSIRIINK